VIYSQRGFRNAALLEVKVESYRAAGGGLRAVLYICLALSFTPHSLLSVQ